MIELWHSGNDYRNISGRNTKVTDESQTKYDFLLPLALDIRDKAYTSSSTVVIVLPPVPQ